MKPRHFFFPLALAASGCNTIVGSWTGVAVNGAELPAEGLDSFSLSIGDELTGEYKATTDGDWSFSGTFGVVVTENEDGTWSVSLEEESEFWDVNLFDCLSRMGTMECTGSEDTYLFDRD
jgi:hypothetical protein